MMEWSQIFQMIITGLTIGSIYALIAVGFVTVYNVTGVLNFAQGEFVMIGALSCITFINMGIPLLLSIILAVVVTGIIGGLVEKSTISPISSKANVVTFIIITLGISILIRGIGYVVWGAYPISMEPFSNAEPIQLFGAVIIPQILWVFGTLAVLLILMYILFEKTTFGAAVKACVVNPNAARLMGINTKKMSTISFVISAAIGAIAGIVIAPITSASYDMGLFIGLKGVVAMVIGGMHSVPGAVIGGLVIGLLETFSGGFISTAYSDAISFGLLILILLFLPGGLMAATTGKRV